MATPRSNRFRKLGLITYNGRIHVNRSLLNVVLHDQLSGKSTVSAPIMDPYPAEQS